MEGGVPTCDSVHSWRIAVSTLIFYVTDTCERFLSCYLLGIFCGACMLLSGFSVCCKLPSFLGFDLSRAGFVVLVLLNIAENVHLHTVSDYIQNCE